MTDIRAAAEAEAWRLYPNKPLDIVKPAVNKSRALRRKAYIRGRMDQARLTPTREQLEIAIMGRTAPAAAKAILKLMQDLASE